MAEQKPKKEPTTKYPECVKLSSHEDEWNDIYPFMEWLQQQGIVLCRYETDEEARARGAHVSEDGTVWKHEDPYPIFKPISDWLHEYFEIDTNKLEKERRALLQKLREDNERRPR